MRDLIVTQNITLDGVIDLAEGWFSPDDAADAFLTGRVTFEQMRSYWPHRTDDPTGVSDYLNRVSKYVVSTTIKDPGWEGTTVLRGPLSADIGALKAAPGGGIVVTGSITLVHHLIAAGVVDEYRLFVYPVVVGRGARLFADATGVPSLRLLETRAFRSGVVLLRYRAT